MSFARSRRVVQTLRSGLLRAWRLPPQERLGFLRAVGGLAWVDMQLRVRGFRQLVKNSETHECGTVPELSRTQRAQIQSYVRWIAAASRLHPMPAHCLHRSLLLQRWLQRDGLESVLRIGVRREGTGMMGHAWIEFGGLVVNDDPSQIASFVPLSGHQGHYLAWTRATDGAAHRAGAVA